MNYLILRNSYSYRINIRKHAYSIYLGNQIRGTISVYYYN